MLLIINRSLKQKESLENAIGTRIVLAINK